MPTLPEPDMPATVHISINTGDQHINISKTQWRDGRGRWHPPIGDLLNDAIADARAWIRRNGRKRAG